MLGQRRLSGTVTFDSILQLPFGWAYLTLFVIVMLRANATYWVGRLVVGRGRRSARLQQLLDSRAMVFAERFIKRWGALAVPLSFLTIGVQTAVNMSAGALRMPLTRYLPAVTLGGLMWALVYSTIGFAALYAVLFGLAGSPWALVALGVAVAVAAGVWWFHRHHGQRELSSESVHAGER
jgi:membrane protein DedA with SNARE-associated domain